MAQQQRNQQAPEPAVAVEVGMQGLELDVEKPDPHERWQAALVVNGAFKVAQELAQPMRWWRNEVGVARARASDSVLRGPHISRQCLRTASASEQSPVSFAEQPHGQGEPGVAFQLFPRVVYRLRGSEADPSEAASTE